MKWDKQGLIYAPRGDLWWARSYALLPTVDIVEDRVLRVYFASLDAKSHGRIGYVELDADNPRRLLYETEEPVLDIGELGTFDDSGVNSSCIVSFGDRKYLYYIGWQRCERVPYMLFTGLAMSEDNVDEFTRYSQVPVLDRTPTEPLSRAAPFVLVEGGVFKAWYWSCEHWSNESGWIHYNNVIRYAESSDGIQWRSSDIVCISPVEAQDYSVGRPSVVREDGIYKMWYSIRGRGRPTYRIGYAESGDAVNWIRRDAEAGICTSESGWDSRMICYPYVVDVSGKRYMFYNGNQHGSTGFGYAILESD